MSSAIDFSTLAIIWKRPFDSSPFSNFFIVAFSDHFVVSILLQHNILKPSKNVRSYFIIIQVSEL